MSGASFAEHSSHYQSLGACMTQVPRNPRTSPSVPWRTHAKRAKIATPSSRPRPWPKTPENETWVRVPNRYLTLMAETQIPPELPEPCPSSPDRSPSRNPIVCDSWQQMIQGVLAVMMLVGAVAMVHYYGPDGSPRTFRPTTCRTQVHELTAEVEQLKQEQAMPAVVLNRYRNSIGYIYGVYQVGFPNHRPTIRARVSGTGFLVGDGLLATNRHVAEPWYGDSEAQKLIDEGAIGTLESLVIFFPGSPTPVNLTPASVSKTSDLAVVRGRRLQRRSRPCRSSTGEINRRSRTARYRDRLSHGHRRNGRQVSVWNLRAPGLPPQ